MTSEYKAEGLIPRVVRGWGRVPDARVWGFIPERGFDPRWWEQASSPAAAPVPTYTARVLTLTGPQTLLTWSASRNFFAGQGAGLQPPSGVRGRPHTLGTSVAPSPR